MAFFNTRKQTKYFRLDTVPGLSGDEVAQNSIDGERRNSGRNWLIEANRPLCRRCSSVARDSVFRWRSRNSRQIKQRKQHTLLRNRVNENRGEDSKVDATPVHQDDEVYRGVNRRMATCEQLEKCALVGKSTLYELRKELVIMISLYELELL